MTMGNTNLPQAGAAGTANGRDTLSGEDQLTDQERKERQQDDQGIGPSPSRPKNAPPRIPGQLRDPGKTRKEKPDQNDRVERPARRGADDPENSADPAAFGGHANTGHSPSDAT
jgi:hypothetical protein